MARLALAGLALGLMALAGLALWSTVANQRAADRIGEMNEIGDRWGRIQQKTRIEEDALDSFVRGGSPESRNPLASAVGGADDDLEWLQNRGDAADIEAARRIRQTYVTYTAAVREVVALGERGDLASAALQADLGAFAASSLQKQISQVVAGKRNQTTQYLLEADQSNRKLRTLTGIAFTIDVVLLGLCSLILLENQRRIRRQAAQSHHDALHDGLTGLGNRTLFTEQTERAILSTDRSAAPIGLLLIDLNKFKEVNDTLGHHVGDLLLRQVADRLRTASREVDLVARLGGDEFAILLPGIDGVANATAIATRIHDALCSPVDMEGMRLEVGASIGVAVYPHHGATPDQLLQHADVAMYAAKRGRHGVIVYEAGLDRHNTAQLTLIGELRKAIERDELVLHYQPQANAHSGEICGVEALVRWRHPQRGLLGPADFISTAEENGLIEPLTYWVLNNALAQCRTWLDAGERLPMSVNVGVDCLQNDEFPAAVSESLARYAVPSEMLTLELTESAMISNPARATAVVRELGALGIRLSIDDFGTGYSSISLLQKLPVHEVKLDRTFVTRMGSDDTDGTIVRALLELGHGFHLQVVAEGIEDLDTWTTLDSLGCDVIQGFYLGKPMPAADFAPWLARHRTAAGATLATDPATPVR
ncbi:putative bifunctional diguanylate cyclase/phosphodiesterase [Paractinoplanes rishiriensis]|nr:EAL domain-containing protein [Actinoplanes rishiriensis]